MAHNSLTKAISRQLAKGMICYVNRQSLKITAVPDLEAGAENTPERQAQVEALENKIRKYYKVPRMTSYEEVHVMKDFINEELSKSIKKELKNALKRTEPVRNYMRIIENDEILEQYWLNFKAKWYQEWVRGYLLDIYKY